MATKERIYGILAAASGPVSRADLEEKLGQSYQTFATQLVRGITRGELEDTGDNHYVLTEKGREILAAPAPQKVKRTVVDEINQLLADRERLTGELKESKDRLKTLAPLEQFALLQEEGKKLQQLVPWSQRVETTLGNFNVKVEGYSFGDFVSVGLEFHPSNELISTITRSSTNPLITVHDPNTFINSLTELLQAISEAIRREEGAVAILKKIGGSRDMILSLARFLSIEKPEENDSKQ